MSVTVRMAVPADVPTIVELGKELHAWSGLIERGLPFDPEWSSKLCLRWLEQPERFGVFMGEIAGVPAGAMAVALNPSFFGDAIFATEVFWGAFAAARGLGVTSALADMALVWARERGATHSCFLVIPHRDQNIVIGSLKRRGYAPLETVWARRV
jgi:GNAT superfamily N-acetyltransferase